MDAIEVQKNHIFDYNKLVNYLDKNLNDNSTKSNNEQSFKIKQFVHGQSNPTFIITYNDYKLVLRKKPPGKLLKGAHMIEREYRIISTLYKEDFPVPKPIIFCNDTSVIGTEFYLMEYVEGRIFRDLRLSNLSPEERFEIYNEHLRVLAQLHSFDFKKLGLEDYGKSENYYQRQINTWTRQYKATETQEIKDMDYVIDWLPKNIPSGANSNKVSIVHGDFRLDNVIFHKEENRIIAVLDWELSTIGSPMSDLSYISLAYHLPVNFFGLGNFDKGYYGIPSEVELKNMYYARSKLSKIRDKDWYFYLTFSAFRMSGILQGVYKRSLLGNASSPFAKDMLSKTLLLSSVSYILSQKSINSENKISKIKEDSLFKFLGKDKLSERFYELFLAITEFMDSDIYPNEKVLHKQISTGKDRWTKYPQIIEDLKIKAKSKGLWNLFLHGISNLTNLEYAILAQITGRSPWLAPEVMNCSAPDTGNMEVLFKYGNYEQKEKYLKPLMNGEIRSCFAMTEKGIPSSDATNIQLTIVPDDKGNYVLNGRKWWISGAGDPRCKVLIILGRTPNMNKPSHQQHSMILAPMNTPGIKIIRPMTLFGYDDAPHGHMDIVFNNVILPKENIILGEGKGFEIAQGRLGPGRIHHCMRMIGISERALENLIDRTGNRKPFGKLLKDNEEVIKIIARCRTEIDQARLLVLFAAYKIDQVGAKQAKSEIAMIKVVAPNVAQTVIDRAMQIHGAEGLSQDTFLAYAFAGARSLRIADGPDEVHLNTLGKHELSKFYPKF